jgi:hypothetical protein
MYGEKSTLAAMENQAGLINMSFWEKKNKMAEKINVANIQDYFVHQLLYIMFLFFDMLKSNALQK